MLFLLYCLLFYFGASLASGLFLCAERLANKQSVIRPRSHCVSCQHLLPWWQLFPLFSYLGLHRRCYYCQAPISMATWWAEIIGGGLAIFIWLTTSTTSELLSTGWLFTGLFLFSWIDIQQQILLPQLFIPWLLTLLLLQATTPHLLAAILLTCCLGLFAYYSHGLGSGDVELLAGLTLLYGLSVSSRILLYGCLLALLGYPLLRKPRLPFIPYLSLGVWLYYLI
ncbi:prepilin peptidase [Loigolactobacillus binensis]|nr:A24 family peptidase [Loigolactobacillus binensis]